MSGLKNLKAIIANLEPELNEGVFVFATVNSTEDIPRSMTLCEIKEKEGITIVISKEHADALQIPYDFEASWITLNVHSALEAVGLTAAFSKALAEVNISCNVIAGYYHDHIFVGTADKEKAIIALKEMAQNFS